MDIVKEVENITDYLSDWERIKHVRNARHIGLLAGMPGLILTLSQTQPLSNREVIEEYIHKTFDILNESTHISPTYCDGLAGYGYVLLQLQKKKLIHTPSLQQDIDAVLSEIDEILQEQIVSLSEQNNFDILHGLVGVGLYFLERENIENLEKIVQLTISQTSQTEDGFIYWTKYDKYDYYDTIIDFGNAHGMGANIFFLSKVLSRNILLSELNSKIKEIVVAAIEFYLNHLQKLDDVIYCYFPLKIKATDFHNKSYKAENSRLGWCYGDLGILYTLLHTINLLGINKHYDSIVSMLRTVAQRRDYEQNFTIDAGFCHGTSGLAIMFLNIYKITNEEFFLETANYWLEQTKAHKEKEKGNINYGFVIVNSIEENLSILEGLAGVLVCYQKFLEWDTSTAEEILMIKY
ncbi:lanthionine synthetase LanC family protein [Bernardetia sp. OM2101]|uniref:lanthionine synthetase LanC family protein n=1 Tax=Bernardetia sp. OM2101 TaxID=3344876 RepID=UPI0035D05AD6